MFQMKALCKFDLLNLPSLMLEHMHKIMIEQNGKHVMGYGYFITKVFKHLEVPLVAGRTGQLSKKSQLVVEQSQLKHELEEMIVLVSKNDAKIALLKAQLAKEQSEGPGSAEVTELRVKNATLLAQNADLQEKPIKAHDAANDRLTLVIQSLPQKPPLS
ncbi:hypothetical protein KY284_032865 [Solanum tuberosum]|nr:hypothetical protein KY284_032865 [Solanum tuberosum]